jgi:hypothetical protein
MVCGCIEVHLFAEGVQIGPKKRLLSRERVEIAVDTFFAAKGNVNIETG